jgi:hypothetical protein
MCLHTLGIPFLNSYMRLRPVLAGKAGSIGRLSQNFMKVQDLRFSFRT